MEKEKQQVVIMPYGKNSLDSPWIKDKTSRDFDVVLLYYHDVVPEALLNHPSFEVHHLKNFKWVMIQDLFTTVKPELISRYDYFFFMDDDVEIATKDISFLFHSMKKYRLEMSQPALTRRSYKSWRSLRRKLFSGIRYVSSVELMCPVMSRAGVETLLSTFALNRSGWGIDILWGKMIREKFGTRSIAVFDTIRATHSKPVGKGELYEKLGNPAVLERDALFERFALDEKSIYSLDLPDNGFFSRLKSYLTLKKEKQAFCTGA